ncbi:MAG: bifunctional UDP-sugar hydrolase/5'-nucleotidase [Anaerolineae bacterium]
MKRLMLSVMVLALLLPVVPVTAQETTTVTMVHFSDYHSHALPFYSEGQDNTAGIARAVAYLKPMADDPNTLIFNGGDTINHGTPAWSDKYMCAEWPWFNGIVDAMAFGNHDADYGPEVFAQCQATVTFPILSSNTLDAAGQPLFQQDGKTYVVFEAGGVKIGVFAVAGSDYVNLLNPETSPVEGVSFSDRIAAAQDVVQALRDEEGVNAVVVIGHSLYEDDLELAQAVPGIDLIFGTHSHRKQELMRIEGTDTYYIAPYQYLTYMSQVQFTFTDGELSDVSGELVRMSSDLPEDPAIAQQVAQMQADLEADPEYAALFESIGEAGVELSTEGKESSESLLGNFVMDIFRAQAGAHMALSTASSFRQPIPPGEILEEELRTALPYTNVIYVYDLTGAQVQELLDLSASYVGSDFFSQVSGVRFTIAGDQARDVQVLNNPDDPGSGYSALDPAATYNVATTNYQGLYASGYKDLFAQASYVDTAIDVRDEVRSFIQENSPVTASLDGRLATGAPTAPEEVPDTGGKPVGPLTVLLVGVILVAAGLLQRRTALCRAG